MTSKEYYNQTKKDFDGEIINHEMDILHDDGLFRHIRFARPDTGIYHFNLTTFPGHLCISGDMGTYVFSRVEDMFRFFRSEDMTINPSYWGEKLKSISTFGGYKKFSVEEFQEDIETWFTEYRECLDDEELSDKIWDDIKARVVDCANNDGAGWEAMRSAIEYTYKEGESNFLMNDGIKIENIFQDFWEHSCTRYDHSYIWCLWAIVHGIKMYDKFGRG